MSPVSGGAVPIEEEEDSENLLKVDPAQPNWQILTKERDQCPTIKDERSTAKCCKITGYRYFAQENGKGKRSMYSGKRQAMHSFLMKQCNDFDAKEHMTLYCFALYMKDTGVTKTSSELEPL